MLITLGKPVEFAVYGVIAGFNGNPLDLLWAIPLLIVSLPLLPFHLRGEQICSEVEHEAFVNKNKHLEKVKLPKNYLYIDTREDAQEFYICPLFYTGELDAFLSLEEARQWLVNNNYREVVNIDNKNYYLNITFWIK